jgi:TolA-binding protein
MRKVMIAALLASVAMAGAPASAQDSPLAPRVDRLEKEMRAVQRKVFPGAGGQQYLEPEIAQPAAPPPQGGIQANSPVADLTARVNSLEEELSRLTGQVETNSFKLRQLEDQFKRFQADSNPQPVAPQGSATPPVVDVPPPPRADAGPGPRSPFTKPAGPGARSAPSDAAIAPPPGPSSGDPAEDAYMAGYHLWEQKKYDDAVTALRGVVTKYPNSKRASYAQNLLGRALLDNGQPAKAAKEFYSNYQTMPRGDRAPDSLYYLGQSLMALRPPKPADACKVYGELMDVYGEKIGQPLKDRVAKGKADAKCGT